MNPENNHSHDESTLLIPKIFYSDATESLIERCVHCDRYLLEAGTHYMIEKSIKNYPNLHATDTIFEYAICVPCILKLRESLSQLSMQRIQYYFLQHSDFQHRLNLALSGQARDLSSMIGECMVKKRPVSEFDEYQIACECSGTQMLYGFLPYALSGEAMEEMMELLSRQTRDELDRFRDDFVRIPPEVKDLLKDRPVVIL